MKVEDIAKLQNGAPIDIVGLVSDKRIGRKKDGNPFLTIIMQDNTGIIAFPLWDNFDHFMETVKINSLIRVRGFAGLYNGNIQIKNPVLKPVSGEYNYEDYIPSYHIRKEHFEYFEKIVNSLEEKYKKIAIAATGAFGYNEERWNAFINCVAAEKYHGNRRGGLFIHTIGVMKIMESVLENYIDNPFYFDAKDVINKDRLMLKAILHDLKKTEEYEYNGIITRKNIKMDHLVLGAAYVRDINRELGGILSEEELDDICYSILSHHGEFGNYPTKGIEDILLNQADIMDSQIVNAVENKI